MAGTAHREGAGEKGERESRLWNCKRGSSLVECELANK